MIIYSELLLTVYLNLENGGKLLMLIYVQVYPAQYQLELQGYPAQSQLELQVYPAQSQLELQVYPAQSQLELQVCPAQSQLELQVYPAQSQLEFVPSEANARHMSRFRNKIILFLIKTVLLTRL